MVRGLVSLLTIGVLASCGLALCVLSAAQPASMVVRLDNAQLVGRSHLVVTGRVAAVKAGAKSREALVAVECALKGAPGKQVTVAFSPGLEDSPVFEVGEVVLLFLTEAEPGRFQVTGGEQGKFSFGKDGPPRPDVRPRQP
jgi:hypothetical protein